MLDDGCRGGRGDGGGDGDSDADGDGDGDGDSDIGDGNTATVRATAMANKGIGKVRLRRVVELRHLRGPFQHRYLDQRKNKDETERQRRWQDQRT